MKFTADNIIAIGLVAALILSIVFQTGGELALSIATGLIGFMRGVSSVSKSDQSGQAHEKTGGDQ